MKALIISGATFISSLCAFTALADNHSAPMVGGVEVFGCHFEDGKDMVDFMKVAGKWNNFANKNFSKSYETHLITHYYFNDWQTDAYWVGFTENHQDMGIIADEWGATGSKLQPSSTQSVQPSRTPSMAG